MNRLNYGANNQYNNYVIIKQSAVNAQTIRVEACQRVYLSRKSNDIQSLAGV